jgi:predicted O-methyltransferase YrrM
MLCQFRSLAPRAYGAGMKETRHRLAQRMVDASGEHDAGEEDRLNRFRNVEPETAELLAVLVRARSAPHVLEIGTSNGYSTIWLADAAEAVGGTVTSVELEAKRSAMARTHLAEAGLSADLRVEDAADTLRGAADESWDLVFLDAERPAYAGYWPDLLRVLRPHGLLAIDNVLSHADQVREVDDLIASEPTVTTALLPIGAGVRLVVRAPR